MPERIETRVAALEQAILQTEGAHYALHDIVAALASRVPEHEFREVIRLLQSHAVHLDPDLGPQRIEAYRSEIASIEDEVGHSQNTSAGLIAKIACGFARAQ